MINLPTTEPLLPLDTWRAALGLHPWHFWGLADTSIVPIESKCSTLVYEHDWQGSDAAGRGTIRDAVARAEGILAAYVGYRPAPAYVSDTLPWPRYRDASQWRVTNQDASGRRVGLMLREGYVQALGVEQRTPIGTEGVTCTDELGTGFDDTFTLTVAIPSGMTVTADQVAVYVAAADRLDNAPVSERWRVQPVQVRISGGNVIVTGRRWLIVRPAAYEAPSGKALNPVDANNFVTTLEVYQRTTNPNGVTVNDCQATLIYGSADCGGFGWGCNDPQSSDPAATGLVVAPRPEFATARWG